MSAQEEAIQLMKDVENFLLLVSYRLNARERQQSQKLLERLGESRDKLSARDDDLYLPMESGQLRDGYVSLEPNSKLDGYTEVDHPEDDRGTYSYAEVRPMKLPSVRGQSKVGGYIGVERKRRDLDETEADGDNPTAGYMNVSKDVEGGYIAVTEGGRDGSMEDKNDGYLELVSDKSAKGAVKAKKTKKWKKDKQKLGKTGSVVDNDGEVAESQTSPNENGARGITRFSLLSRVGAKMKLTKQRKPSGGEKSPGLTVQVAELTNPTFEGLLYRRKQGIGRMSWEPALWYILHNHTLYHCSSGDNENAIKDFPVFSYSVKPFETKQHEYAFELSHPGVNTVIFRADNSEQRDKWIEALTQASLIEGLSMPNSQAIADDQDVYENADDEPSGKPNQPIMEKPDVHENPVIPKPSKTPSKLSKSSLVSSEKAYENIDIELYEDVEEKVSVFRAIKSHKATDDDELSFKVGDLVLMDNMDNESWWVGTLQNKATREFTGERGFVPKTYFVSVSS
jgi:hypothetical protein